MPSAPTEQRDRCHAAEIQSGHSSNGCPKRKTKLRELHSVAGMQSRDSHAPLAKEQEPFTGEPVPADRAENSSAGTKPERQKERNHMGDK